MDWIPGNSTCDLAAHAGDLGQGRLRVLNREQLFKAIDQISQSPEKYIQFTDPRRMEMPDYKLWDFEPVHRSPGF